MSYVCRRQEIDPQVEIQVVDCLFTFNYAMSDRTDWAKFLILLFLFTFSSSACFPWSKYSIVNCIVQFCLHMFFISEHYINPFSHLLMFLFQDILTGELFISSPKESQRQGQMIEDAHNEKWQSLSGRLFFLYLSGYSRW